VEYVLNVIAKCYSAGMNFPQPPSPKNSLERFIGPGYTRAELWLQFSVTLVAALAVPVYAYWVNLDWTILLFVMATLLAADLVGGVMTNATSAAKRWYHRKGQTKTQHLIFIAVHALQLFLVAYFFRGGDWTFFITVYAYLLLASLLILNLPLYLQRPFAMLFFVDALVLNAYIFQATPGLEWFLPIFFLKLIVCHLLPEYPFSPKDKMG
jgi:hypothetical protein